MKGKGGIAAAVLVGIAIGIAGARAGHAGRVEAAPGYIIAEVDVTDPTGMAKYGARVPETLAPFDHHFLVSGGNAQGLEGDPPKGIVVIAFESAEKAREWYYSPAYQAIKPLRQSSAKARIFSVEGVLPK